MSANCEMLLAGGAMKKYRITSTDAYAEKLRSVLSMTEEELQSASKDESLNGGIECDFVAALDHGTHSGKLNQLRRTFATDTSRGISSQHFYTVEMALGDPILADKYIECLRLRSRERGLQAECQCSGPLIALITLIYEKKIIGGQDWAIVDSVSVVNGQQVDGAIAKGTRIGLEGVTGIFRRIDEMECMVIVVNCKDDLGTEPIVIPPVVGPSYQFIVSTQTGKRRHGDPTNAWVFCRLHGSLGSTPVMRLNNPDHNDFKAGKVDVFANLPKVQDVGNLESIEFSIEKQPGGDGLDDWTCAKALVTRGSDAWTTRYGFAIGDAAGRHTIEVIPLKREG